MSKQHSVSFIDSLYKKALIVVIGGDRNKYLEKTLGVKPEWLDSSRDRRVEGMYFRIKRENNTKNYNLSVIWLKSPSIPQLTHELIHFCNAVFMENDIGYSLDNDEAYAYYIEHWLMRIGKKIRLKFL